MSDSDRERADAMGRGFAGEPPGDGPSRDAQMVAYLQGQKYRSEKFPPRAIAYTPRDYVSMAYDQCRRDHPEPNAADYGGEGWFYCRALEERDFRLREVLFSASKRHRAYIYSDGRLDTSPISFRTDLADTAIAREIAKLQRLPAFLRLPDSPESYAAYLERFREFDEGIRKWCVATYEKYDVPVPEDWKIPGRPTGLPATAQPQADWKSGVAALRIERAVLFIPKTYLIYESRSVSTAEDAANTAAGERASREYEDKVTRVSIALYEELGLPIPEAWADTRRQMGAVTAVQVQVPVPLATARADLAYTILKEEAPQVPPTRSRRKWVWIALAAAAVGATVAGVKLARGADGIDAAPSRSFVDFSKDGPLNYIDQSVARGIGARPAKAGRALFACAHRAP